MDVPQPEAINWSAELVKYLPIVVGGLLAAGGGWFGQFLTHSYSAKRERNKLLRDKAERLCTRLTDMSEWLQARRNKYLYSLEDHDTPSPLSEVRTLQKLYFPTLKKQIDDVSSETIKMIRILGEEGIAVREAKHQIEQAELQREYAIKATGKAENEAVIVAMKASAAVTKTADEKFVAAYGNFFPQIAAAITAVADIVKDLD